MGYRELAGDVSRPDPDDAVFLCGPRCSAEVFLGPHRIGRTALSPLDVLECLDVQLAGEQDVVTRLHPGHLEKSHDLDHGVAGRSRWFAAAEDPCVVLWLTLANRGSATRTVDVSATARYNVNYVSKFRGCPNDRAELAGDRLTVRDARFPALHAVTATHPAWSRPQVEVEPADASSPRTETNGDVGVVSARWVNSITVGPGGEADLVIVVAGSDREGVAEAAATAVLADPAGAFAQMIALWEDATRSGVVLDSGRTPVDRLFAHAKLWAHKDARMVPLGPPYALGRVDNAELLALTASPDYHGIFANDAGQSCWELGALGPRFYPVLDHTLDVLFHFGLPESVEVDPFGGSGTPWLSPLRIGERPQWVMGATALVLWSGTYADRYWPRVRAVLDGFGDHDRDGDWLDDHSSSTFPEQPDPGRFRHEMLYASAFWFQAFTLGSELAAYVGDAGRATEYERSAGRVREAVEHRFGAGFGYASWLDVEHAQHPHRGHTMVLPLQYGMASPERAAAAFETLLHPPLWTDDGPLAMEPAYPNDGGAHAWGFMRWNLVDALFRHGRTDEAAALLERWAGEEDELRFQAPEGFPTVTGVTGKGYVWTAARSLRAVLLGLAGIRLTAAGLVVTPRLPAGWGPVRLLGVPFRGSTYDIVVQHAPRPALLVDGTPLPWATPIRPTAAPGHHVVSVSV